MRRLRQQFQERLVVVGVHTAKFTAEHDLDHLRASLGRLGITHAVVQDRDHWVWESFTVRAWPTVVLIDPEGYVVGMQAGELNEKAMAERIETLLTQADSGAGPGFDTGPEAAGGATGAAPAAVPAPSRGSPAPIEPADDQAAALRFPGAVLADGTRLYVADTGHHRVLEITLDAEGSEGAVSGIVSRRFGTRTPGFVDGAGEDARFRAPRGLALHQRTLYVADTSNHAVRAIDLDRGEVGTVAGTGLLARGPIVATRPCATDLRSPWDLLAFDGVLLIAMAGSHQLWMLLEDEDHPAGHLTVFAGTGREALVDARLREASFNQPSGLAYGGGRVYVADAEASAVRVIDFAREARVKTLVGSGLFDFGDVDGDDERVRLQHPSGIAVRPRPESETPAGHVVLIADTYNHKVKRLDPARGTVETVIGSGTAGHADGPIASATLAHPEGLDLSGERLWIADTDNHAVRCADLHHETVTTLTLRSVEPTTTRGGK